MRSGLLIPICLALLLAASFPGHNACAQSPADEVVALVNALRQENGLPALNAHPILMQLAQAQANYLASTGGGGGHLNAAGQRPFQRALAAGYPVAGDLSLGGFFAENMEFGTGLTPQQVVEAWMGDDLHSNTLFSEWRSDMGVGVADDGSMTYYVLDTALAGSPAAVRTQAAGLALDLSSGQAFPVIAPGATSTPAADGSIVHTVRQGETLWGIAAVYQVSVDQVAAYNRLNRAYFIHPGDALLVHLPVTATPPPLPTVASRVDRTSGRVAATPSFVLLALAQPAAPAARRLPVTRLLGWGLLLLSMSGGLWLLIDARRKR